MNLSDLSEKIEQLRATVIADSAMLRCLIGSAPTLHLTYALDVYKKLAGDISVKVLFSTSSDETNLAYQARLMYWQDEVSAEVAARKAASPSASARPLE